MSNQRIAGEFGRLLAGGAVAHSLSVEAGLTSGPICAFPVALEPAFTPVDPRRTFEPVGRRITQSSSSQEWITRRLILPALDAVDWSRSEAFVAGLAGCRKSVCFDLLVRASRASFFLSASPDDSGFVDATWSAAFSDGATVPASDPWVSLHAPVRVLYDLFSPAPYHRCIRANRAVSAWAYLLPLATHLTRDDVLFARILFVPVRGAWQSNIALLPEMERSLGDRAPHGRSAAVKNPAEPLFAAAIQLGTTMPSLASSLQAFCGIFTADGKPFGRRCIEEFHRVLSPDDVTVMLRERRTHAAGTLFSSSELVLLVHPPDRGAAGVVGLEFVDGLLVPVRLQGKGMPLGMNASRGVPVAVVDPDDQENKGCWWFGRSRSGKSCALVHKGRYLADAGYGLGLIDPHRSTAFALLSSLDEVDPERFVFLDFDDALPVAYNPFDNANVTEYGRLTTEFVHSLKHLFDAAGYHRMAHFLGMAVFALFVLKENLASIPSLFAKTPAGDALRRRVIAGATNAEVRRFWEEEFPMHRAEAFAPIVNRLSALLLDEHTHQTFVQKENKVNIARIMDEQQILIVALPASVDAGSIVGGMLIAQAIHAAFRRVGTPQAAHKFHLIADEFHRLLSSANALQCIANETGKGGLSMTLANQETGQLPGELLTTLYSMPSVFVFSVNLPDAKHLVQLFKGQVRPETLASQPTGSVYARIGQDIVSFQCPPPYVTPNPDRAAQIIAHSRARYYATPSVVAPAQARRIPRIIETFPKE